MLLQIPFQFDPGVQNAVLALNSAALAFLLIFMEIIYARGRRESRAQLAYFYPLIVVLVGILVFAAYRQMGQA